MIHASSQTERWRLSFSAWRSLCSLRAVSVSAKGSHIFAPLLVLLKCFKPSVEMWMRHELIPVHFLHRCYSLKACPPHLTKNFTIVLCSALLLLVIIMYNFAKLHSQERVQNKQMSTNHSKTWWNSLSRSPPPFPSICSAPVLPGARIQHVSWYFIVTPRSFIFKMK